MDWVKAHFDCSTGHAWLALKERAKADIAQWRAHQSDAKVNVSEEGGRLLVSRAGDFGIEFWASLSSAQGYLLVRTGSAAAPNPDKEIRLFPTVNAAGECRLVHDGSELEFWQASRLLLQAVLFA
jgi:hypothetical protein